ncbi:MAG: arabinogalactan endo-1,4-beta-galactosidase [Prevotella sp.]|nr:arabinogalactan endo-1,4-beta-galactosidase [Prevotella sp.]
MKNSKIIFALATISFGIANVHAQQHLLGGDISLLPSYEEQGTVYKDADGNAVNLLEYVKDQQWNAIRVRLFVEPEKAPGEHKGEGVCQDLEYVKNFGRRIKAAGYQFMLDFHYSDTWADPAKQFMPDRWRDAKREDLPDSLYEYTKLCLKELVNAGATPDLIQVGNEITNGMMWPAAKVDPRETENWDLLVKLLESGSKACREVCPNAKIIIHTEKAGEWEVTKAYYENLRTLDYDIIGLSYYPIWHKSVGVLAATIDSLGVDFPDKEVMVVETAMYFSHENDKWSKKDQYSEFYPISIEGQRIFTHELVAELRRHPNVTGLFWWYPEENAFGNNVTEGWLNRGLFDNHTGKVLPAMRELSKFMDD